MWYNRLCVNLQDNRKQRYVNFFRLSLLFASNRHTFLNQHLTFVSPQLRSKGQNTNLFLLFLFVWFELKDIIDRFIVEPTNYVELIKKPLRLTRYKHSTGCGNEYKNGIQGKRTFAKKFSCRGVKNQIIEPENEESLKLLLSTILSRS